MEHGVDYVIACVFSSIVDNVWGGMCGMDGPLALYEPEAEPFLLEVTNFPTCHEYRHI